MRKKLWFKVYYISSNKRVIGSIEKGQIGQHYPRHTKEHPPVQSHLLDLQLITFSKKCFPANTCFRNESKHPWMQGRLSLGGCPELVTACVLAVSQRAVLALVHAQVCAHAVRLDACGRVKRKNETRCRKSLHQMPNDSADFLTQ